MRSSVIYIYRDETRGLVEVDTRSTTVAEQLPPEWRDWARKKNEADRIADIRRYRRRITLWIGGALVIAAVIALVGWWVK